jgi:Fic family protein
MVFSPRFSITNSITAALTKIERARGFLEAAKLSKDWISEMQNRALVLEAHHTTHIEGTHLTLEQSEKLLSGKKVVGVDPNDQRELLNYRDAFDFVTEYLDSGGSVTEGLIREIHKRLVRGVRGDKAEPGDYRNVQNYVVNSKTKQVIYTPPSPLAVPALMAEIAAWLGAEREVNPVLVAGIAQFQLVHIHPFVDGNGRTSRLLSTLFLYKTGYDFKRLFTVSEYYDRDRQAFYTAIQNVREQGMDLTGWLEFFVTGLAIQMREVQERGERVIRSDVLAQKHQLSERQRRLIGYLLEKSGVTIQEFEALYPKINRRTLQRELAGLIEKGLVVTEGATNQLRYILVKN